MQFSQNRFHVINMDDQFLNKVMTTDEGHFHLNGFVNNQNFRYWALQNPYLFHSKPLHSEKVTVWCAVSMFGVVSPYFLRMKNENQ